jgi:hypothetical protein
MLKTPATRIYWKQDSENSTVFSKLAACSRLSTVPTSGLAGEYLRNQLINRHPLHSSYHVNVTALTKAGPAPRKMPRTGLRS